MLFKGKKQNRNLALGLDLGTSHIKAAVVSKQTDRLELTEYAVRKVRCIGDKGVSAQQYAEELHQLVNSLATQERHAYVAISCNSAMVCHTEFPRMPMDEVKSALRLTSARFLRRDFSNYYLDAVELVEPAAAEKGKKNAKMSVLVGGASKEEVSWYRTVLMEARIRAEAIDLAAVSVINAFQANYPDLCEKEAVLLVDIGARSTTINFLRQGVPVMTRIMHFGGQQLSDQVAQILTLQAHQAEDEKIKMTEPVQNVVHTAIAPLAREIRSSIDFFERQHECHVSRVFAAGGSATGAKVLEFLSDDIGVCVEALNPTQNLDTTHFNGDGAALQAIAPSLAVAVGAATSRL